MARPRSGSPAIEPIGGTTNSPPPALSKRDKRRTMLSERLTEMVSAFGANLRPHYEAQVNAINIDISLILQADPYQNKPLEDDPEEIQAKVTAMAGNNVPAEVARDDFAAGAGKMYTEFVHRVNDAMEERDVNLTFLANKYESSRAEIEQRHQFQTRLAQEEHRLLSETIRQRLIQQVTQKKARLMKEKEQLDLGDSNAMLLHANQFSILNPASPGGTHKRHTRNTGRRGADPDDLPQENKRKRKAMFEDPESRSPAPIPSHDTIMNAPWRDARAKTVYDQFESPAYSVERLFTEKELAMHMNQAAIAASNFLVKLNDARNGQPANATNGLNGAHSTANNATSNPNNSNSLAPTSTGHSALPPNGTSNPSREPTPSPAAVEMERTVSQQQTHHATRGATRNAISDLTTASAASIPGGVHDFSLGMSVFPSTIITAAAGGKANGAPVTAEKLSQAEIEADLAMMTPTQTSARGGAAAQAAALADENAANSRLLERSLLPAAPAEYQFRPPTLLPSLESWERGAGLGIGDVPMSRQTSAAGEAGGVPMSRGGSAMGGVGMRRSGSGTGSLLGEGRRRGRVG